MYKQFVVAALTTFVMACGGSGGAGGGSESTACVNVTGGVQTCTGYANVAGSFKSSEESSCRQAGGTVASSCPTASLDGCCHTAAGTIKEENCFYSNDATDEESSCTSDNGTWTTTP